MDTVEALAGSIICRYIEDEDVATIHASGAMRDYPANCTLFSEGDPGGSLFVILSGKVAVWKKAGPSDQRLLATLLPGDIIGEISLVDASPRSALALTVSECKMFELSRRDLMAVIRSRPATAAKVLWAILETVSLRLRDMNAESVRWNLEGGRDLPKLDF